MVLLVYKTNLISTIVDVLNGGNLQQVYKTNLISTIVDSVEYRESTIRVYKTNLISTIVDGGSYIVHKYTSIRLI